MELKNAIEEIGEQYSDLWSFTQVLVEPIQERYPPYDAFRSRLYKAILLSVFSKIHPFEVFKSPPLEHLIIQKLDKKRECFNFLIQIRDSKRISEEKLPSSLIRRIAERWNDEDFLFTANSLENSDEKLEYSKKYNSHCHYIAEIITQYGGSIALLLEELDANIEEPNWKHNQGLAIFLNNQKISVAPVDLLGNQRVSHNNSIGFKKNSLGIFTTNPIWNPTVIDNFEYLLNKDRINEKEFQSFFEIYPEFILRDLHIAALPQITLVNEFNRKLRPDFILKRVDSTSFDILEIKRPITNKLFSGTSNREVPTLELLHHIRQLQDYKNYFQSALNRREFNKKHRLDGFEPVISLLIGRRASFGNQEILTRIMQGQGVNILTYDDILDMIKLRAKRSMQI